MKFKIFGHDIIKIPGKQFDDLTLREVAKMIEADSAISPEGNDYFSGDALDVFLHNAEITRPDLIHLRDKILENIYIDVDGSKVKEINTEYLTKLAADLESRPDV